MRWVTWAWVVAVVLAAGCGSGQKTDPGPPIQKNPKGPGPMKPPGEGPPSLPPGRK